MIDRTDTKAILLTSTRSYNETDSEPGIFLISFLGALMAVGLCILAGVVVCCMFKLILHRRKGKEGVTGSSKEEHYEVIDPIYEAINADSIRSSSGVCITMDNNDAYKTTKFVGKTSYASEGIDVANNKAYIQISSELDILPMEHNGSYQAAPFKFIFPVAPAGVTSARTQECYDKQSVHNLKNIHQRRGCTEAPASQNYKIAEFQNQDVVLCVKGVDMNGTDSSMN